MLYLMTVIKLPSIFFQNTCIMPSTYNPAVIYGTEDFSAPSMVEMQRYPNIIRPYLFSPRRYFRGFVLRADRRSKEEVFEDGFLIKEANKFHDLNNEEIEKLKKANRYRDDIEKSSKQIALATGADPSGHFTLSYGISTTTKLYIAKLFAKRDGHVYLIDAREFYGVIIDVVNTVERPASWKEWFTGRQNPPYDEVNYLHSIPGSHILGEWIEGGRLEVNKNFHVADSLYPGDYVGSIGRTGFETEV
ncbi:hypothetical protein DC094_06875 [Pelagibaculum spongiae]|uniref:Uncharacterized protein n=2 Tax=Pelagibaculum spongiae TaxID=2080658 RepID=A0A2V1H1K3_9GAMM|nr:hypothetical protein DC094_06875 [Pelagibaculum spongiae]